MYRTAMCSRCSHVDVARSRKLSLTWLLCTTAIASGILLSAGAACANPSGGRVVGGSASISQVPGATTIDQKSNKAIINWQGFSIAPGEVTKFNQPGRDAIALNRVRGKERSDLLGRLEANGNVWLINPNGVLVGPQAKINVGGFLATTADIRDADFLAGRFDFSIPSPNTEAAIVNQGTISIREKGMAALVAPHVRNEGVIQGNLAQVVVAGAPTFAVDFYGDGLINFQATSQVTTVADSNQPLIENSGTIRAEGGRVLLTADAAAGVVENVIDMAGVVEARSFAMNGGEIVLDGGSSGIVAVNGTLDASGSDSGERGGVVKVVGEKVGLFDGAQVTVAGDAGGGTALTGGNFQGKGPERNAKRTYVAANARIAADARTTGDGGKVIVWADEVTRFDGTVSARGGAASGNGGFVEVSGKNQLGFKGQIDVKATNGADGAVLFDPADILVSDADPPVGFADADGFVSADGIVSFDEHFIEGPPGFLIAPSTLAALSGNISLQATNDINIASALTLTNQTAGETFSLQAGSDIAINAAITTAGANVNLEADSPSSPVGGGDSIGSITINASISANGGNISAQADNSAAVGNGIAIADGFVLSTIGSGTIRLEGTGGTGTGNHGVITQGTVQTEDGNIDITGRGTGSAVSFNNDGVSIFNGGIVEALGTGNIAINGFGGFGVRDNQGVAIGSSTNAAGNSIVRVADGNIQIIGSGNSNAFDAGTFGSHGIFIFDAAVVAATGAGTINMDGTGANGVSGIVASTFTDFEAPDTISIGTGSGGGALVFNATNGIILDTAAGVPAIDMSAGSGDLILRADADNNGTGSISAPSGGTLAMGTGDLALQAAEGIGGAGADGFLDATGMTSLAVQNTTSGAVRIANLSAGTVTVSTVAGVSGLTNSADEIRLTAEQPGSAIVISQPVTAGNLVTINSPTLTLQANVQGNNGVILGADNIAQTAGVITTPILTLQNRTTSGVQSFLLTGNNQVEQLSVPPQASIGGADSIDFVNGRDLTVSGIEASTVNLGVVGRLTLLPGANIVATGAGTPILIRADAFTNNAGAAGMQPGTGRFLVYSVDPNNDQTGGLAGEVRLNSSFASVPPDSPALTAGTDFFLYEVVVPPPPPPPPQLTDVPPDVLNPVIPSFETTHAIAQALAATPQAVVATAPAQPRLQSFDGGKGSDDLYYSWSGDGNHELWELTNFPLAAGPAGRPENATSR